MRKHTLFLTHEQFNKELETGLLIVNYPNKRRKYYICEITYAVGGKRIVHIYINY